MIFTCSWSDWFIEEADAWREEAWEVIRKSPQHTFQILTKRPELALDRLPKGWPLANVWLGVSIEDRKHGLPRLNALRQIPAAVRFLSVEPLLEDLGEFSLNDIHWVIVGGESGPQFRPMKESWVDAVFENCKQAHIPFFFKQWGGKTKSGGAWGGRVYKGVTWDELPARSATSNRIGNLFPHGAEP